MDVRPRGRVDLATPSVWDNDYFEKLFTYDWELVTKSPAGAQPVVSPSRERSRRCATVPDAHQEGTRHAHSR